MQDIHSAMARQGEGRVIGCYKPFNRSLTVSSHWESVEKMLAEAKERYGVIEWYRVGNGPKIYL